MEQQRPQGHPANGIAELIASIAANGLLQSLVVRKAARGKYAVIAGGWRHGALRHRAAQPEPKRLR